MISGQNTKTPETSLRPQKWATSGRPFLEGFPLPHVQKTRKKHRPLCPDVALADYRLAVRFLRRPRSFHDRDVVLPGEELPHDRGVRVRELVKNDVAWVLLGQLLVHYFHRRSLNYLRDVPRLSRRLCTGFPRQRQHSKVGDFPTDHPVFSPAIWCALFRGS